MGEMLLATAAVQDKTTFARSVFTTTEGPPLIDAIAPRPRRARKGKQEHLPDGALKLACAAWELSQIGEELRVQHAEAEELREQDHIVAASEEEAIEEAAARAQVFVSKQFTNFVPNLANIEVLPPIKVVERLRTTLEAYDLERRRLFYLADMDKGHLKTKGSVPERVQRTIDELFVLENALGGMGKTMRDAQRHHQKLVKEARPAREVAERAAIDGEEDDDDYGDVFDDDDFGEEVGDEFGVDDDDIASQRSGEGAST